MLNILEFQKWLDNCCRDGESKLGLTKEDIVFALLDRAKQLLVLYLAEERRKKQNGRGR